MFPEAYAYAFEPNPIYQERLERYANEDPRFRPQFFALSDGEGSVDLQITESPGTTSIFAPGKRLKRMYPDETEIKSVATIKAVTIDGWAARNGAPDIQLMKFDIQGAELKALRGATGVLQRSALLVYTEILFNPLYDDGTIHSEVDLCLRESGFVIYDIYKPRYDKNGVLMWANAIFVHSDRVGI